MPETPVLPRRLVPVDPAEAPAVQEEALPVQVVPEALKSAIA